MKVDTANIENAENITSPVGGGGIKGQSYETIKDWTGIEQLDRLDDKTAVVVRRSAEGAVSLESLPLP